ncbi:capsid assembly scaffolding protein Gp46 family protein [Clostridium sp. UBA7791]|uniref:capsid assembly scaffolding protein Gp46 family protein n=1 Tax=Clostridium sp. UBA7791 TaxID=1946379 RepID=UPI003216280B
MKKNELLKLIESLEDEAEVLDTLKEHEEIKSLAKDFNVNEIALEDFTKLLQENPTIKGYWTSEKDRAVSKGVNTFKENNLQKLIDEAIKSKSNEGKTPEQIALEEIQKKYEAMEKQMKMKDLESKYKDTLSEKGLDTRLMKFILSENEEDITKNIEFFTDIISSNTNLKVNERLNESSYKPKNNKDLNNNKTMTKEELLNKGIFYVSKFQEENPEEYKLIMNS